MGVQVQNSLQCHFGSWDVESCHHAWSKTSKPEYKPPLRYSTGGKKCCSIPFHIHHRIYIMCTVSRGVNSFLPYITSPMEVFSSWKNNTITIKLMPVMPRPYFHMINHQTGSYCGSSKGFWCLMVHHLQYSPRQQKWKAFQTNIITKSSFLFMRRLIFSASHNNRTNKGVIGHFSFSVLACNVADLEAIKACLPLLFTDHLQSMNY